MIKILQHDRTLQYCVGDDMVGQICLSTSDKKIMEILRLKRLKDEEPISRKQLKKLLEELVEDEDFVWSIISDKDQIDEPFSDVEPIEISVPKITIASSLKEELPTYLL